ncbi:MAG: hypothetical protein HY868_25490 [Chloroflexi bacterium]|nr:hypothetical protein [Chloroflexota bacterium]
MKKKTMAATPAATQHAFASAAQTDSVQLIYASAFADAVKQLNASLTEGNSLSAQLRARATELNQLGDLVDTTLAASQAEPGEDDEAKEDPEKPTTEAAKDEDKSAAEAK